MATRTRIFLEPPPTFPPFPGWVRRAMAAESVDDAMFSAGAALAAIHPIARSEHPLGALWRHRLSLSNAAVLARQGGRTEDEAALRTEAAARREAEAAVLAARAAEAEATAGTRAASTCLLYTSPSPRDRTRSRMPSSA